MAFRPEPSDTLTYEPYFGLTEKAFSLNADSRFVYESPTFGAARANLLAGIRRREGLLVLTGEIGSGKTTLCRAVLRDLGRKMYSSLVPDPFASREDLLKMLLIDFGVLSIHELTTGPLRGASRTELGYLLASFLESLTADTYVVVIIDEAQNLSLPLIEEIRILSDTFGAAGRLQIVFAGQPELHAKLKLPEMRQVDQRVCGYHRLAPMSREAVAGYVSHRLQVAGGAPDRELFPADVIDVFHRRSGGVPRLINRVCDRALQLAYEVKGDGVSREIIETALTELGAATLAPTWDSIIFAEPPSQPLSAIVTAIPEVERTSAPAVAPAAATVPAAEDLTDEESFKNDIELWVLQDLKPPSRTPSRPSVFFDEDAPIATPPAPRTPSNAPRPEVSTRAIKMDWPDDVRSENYLHKLMRVWAKRAVIVLGVVTILAALMAGGSRLSGAMNPGELPDTPDRPAPAIRDLVLPDLPPDIPVADGAVSVAAAADYLVAVGLFADPERADQIVDTLAQTGLPAMQRLFQRGGRQLNQIVLGPFLSRADAVEDLRRLQKLGGFDDAQIVSGDQ